MLNRVKLSFWVCLKFGRFVGGFIYWAVATLRRNLFIKYSVHIKAGSLLSIETSYREQESWPRLNKMCLCDPRQLRRKSKPSLSGLPQMHHFLTSYKSSLYSKGVVECAFSLARLCLIVNFFSLCLVFCTSPLCQSVLCFLSVLFLPISLLHSH